MPHFEEEVLDRVEVNRSTSTCVIAHNMDGSLYHDVAPPHFNHHVRQHLADTFGKRIGRGDPVSCPPRSPDIMPVNLFLCCYIKSFVCS
ncbi:hypothetical protein PR048_001032, partial [Dryococelus australis]